MRPAPPLPTSVPSPEADSAQTCDQEEKAQSQSHSEIVQTAVEAHAVVESLEEVAEDEKLGTAWEATCLLVVRVLFPPSFSVFLNFTLSLSFLFLLRSYVVFVQLLLCIALLDFIFCRTFSNSPRSVSLLLLILS